MTTIADRVARTLLAVKCVQLRTNPLFQYSSGLKGPIYCDNRLLLSHVQERALVIDALVELLQEQKAQFDVVMGIATAGIAPAALLAEKLGLPLCYIRTKAKDHGTKKLIEGEVKIGQKILLVEDLINQGSSTLPLIEYLQDQGHQVAGLTCFVNYEMPQVGKVLKERSVPLYQLTGLSNILHIAVKDNIISKADCALVEKWQRDPQHFSLS